MANLRINSVRYEGRNYVFQSPRFGAGISIIEGDNGTGKSTFFSLIYYALGGNVSSFKKTPGKEWHREIVEDEDNWVEIDISIENRSFFVRRLIGDTDILVTPYSTTDNHPHVEVGSTVVLPINRGEGRGRTFSDWLLDHLAISIVEIFQGYKNFRINSADLLRLVYHDQAVDPDKIYKEPDSSNFVSDSSLLRQIIFQLLVGKSFSDYYNAVSEFKKAERDRDSSYALLQEYLQLSRALSGEQNIRNIEHLKEEIKSKELQLERLHKSRIAVKNNARNQILHAPDFERLHSDLLTHELALSELNERLLASYREESKIVRLRRDLEMDLERISKIVHTHEQLSLFSSDTCPYCLSAVTRDKGKCVCGADVDEQKYERFFYSSNEYKDIYKSKFKSLETLDRAYQELQHEVTSVQSTITDHQRACKELRSRLQVASSQSSPHVELDEINDLDDLILEVREEIADIERTINMEAKLHSRQVAYDQARATLEAAKIKVRRYESAAHEEIFERASQFSRYYNGFMQKALPDCRSARIDPETYMPEINNGEYREASARVPKRLMYFLTLLQLSLLNDDVKYPALLLIDTPETMGIETKWLIGAMEQFDILENPKKKEWQIIISTGLGKYPPSQEQNIVISLCKTERLLKPRKAADE
jgi:hypothetical protein